MSETKIEDGGRGTGRTTKQMKEAPQDALFVWCDRRSLRYARDLAEFWRPDLRVVSPETLESLRGLMFGGVVVDHAARLTEKQQKAANSLAAQP